MRWLSSPHYRVTSVSLNAAFFRQPFADLYLGTTAIEAVDKISQVFKCDRLPQPSYDTVLFWILRPFPFAKVVARKLGLERAALYWGGALGSIAITTDKLLRRRWSRKLSSNLSIASIPVEQIGDEFDELWSAKRAERIRLLADRSAAILRWHFNIPGDQSAIEVLCCKEKNKLNGYLILRHEPPRGDGPRRSIICDMIVKDDRESLVRSLFIEAHNAADRAGSHVLEVIGFPTHIRETLQESHPYERKLPACPFHFKTAAPRFHQSLMEESVWYANPYDGDATLMPATE